MPTNQTINSDTEVFSNRRSKELAAKLLLSKPADTEKPSEIVVTQTTPTAPTLLTATDLTYGDKVRLVWSGGGPLYNVYFKKTIDVLYTKANILPLSSSTTQYDVGGLLVDIAYNFVVRGVNGAGTESVNSNVLTRTPTLSVSDSAFRFRNPTWEVRVNSVTRADAVLADVTLAYGTGGSTATFSIKEDPDDGGFPVYNDTVDVYINSRKVLTGKIKGITPHIGIDGLQKTFTVVTNITDYQQKVVTREKTFWNIQKGFVGLRPLYINSLFPSVTTKTAFTADKILNYILGYIPENTPADSPGEVTLTDQTKLDAVETIVRKLGNYQLFYDQTTGLLEFYQFGQGGQTQRQFIKGRNLIEENLTENRQNVVDKLTIIGPPKQIRVRRDVTAQLTPEIVNGGISYSVTIDAANEDTVGENIRDIEVEGIERDQPTFEESGELQVLPEDMGLLPFGDIPAHWPTRTNTSDEVAVNGFSVGFRKALKSLIVPSTVVSKLSAVPSYPSNHEVKLTLSDLPKIWYSKTIANDVEKVNIGVVGATPGELIHVEVLTELAWISGSVFALFTYNSDRPTVTIGGGDVERTITDEQYQIFINQIPGQLFSNQSIVLALMQDRLESEFAKLNTPKISGTMTVIGDETIDLKTSVITQDLILDVTRVTHTFTDGFRTQVTLTNEPFIEVVGGFIPPQPQQEQDERNAKTSLRQSFEEVSIDQNITTQRQKDFKSKFTDADTSSAKYLP